MDARYSVVHRDYSPNKIVINICIDYSLFIFILHFKFVRYITLFDDLYNHIA